MKPIERLGVVGVGLIGGSLALAARRAGLAREVVGLGRGWENLRVALERGVVDRADVDPRILAGADLVLLATPVAAVPAAAAAVAQWVAPGAIVTDAGSVKAVLVERCTAVLGGRARFVGGHPIAGTEASGAGAADADLFRGARCVLTPVAGTDPQALARVRELWEAVGMRVSEMAPEAHDEILALTSHVPHLLAFALALAAEQPGERGGPSPLELAGPSFRSATRVAASSPEMWRDVLLANAPALRRALAGTREVLARLERAVAEGDAAELERLIGAARAARRRLDSIDGIEAPDAAAARPRASRVACAQGEAGLVVEPAIGPLRGSIEVPGDKSIAHRALLFGAVAQGETVVRGVGRGEDNASTIRVLRSLGVAIERDSDVVRIAGRGFEGLVAPSEVLDCGNSGTTMRLLAGLLAALPFVARLDGDASLRRRPMRRVIEPLAEMGARIESDDGRPPLVVHGGRLRAASFVLPVASAQVKTALLLAGLQSEGETAVAEPGASRDHTERLLPAFGGVLERRGPRVVAVRGPQALRAAVVAVPGDPSAAAFWLVAASIVPGSVVRLCRVGMNPTRTGAIDVLRAMGASIELVACEPVGEEPVADLEVRAAPLHATVVEGETMLRAIDEFPVLAVAAACARGETRFADASELRVKESDRLRAMADGLRRLGAEVVESADGMTVRGPARLHGGAVESHGDHRIAMAFAVAALVADGPVAIGESRSIAVSYPEFLETLARLEGAAS